MAIDRITVRGARQHNLKNIDVDIPRDKLTVITGLSGSGKSSLAFDTIYAEGQRRYVESLSAYARQFLDQLEKPDVDSVEGLSPAISIEQKTVARSPRSTIGTVTEIYDYLRILMARLGQPHCPDCEIPIGTQTADQVVDSVLAEPPGSRLYLMAPVQIDVGQQYTPLWDQLRATGYNRVRIDGVSHTLEDVPTIDRRRKHKVEVVIDRVVVKPDARSQGSLALDAQRKPAALRAERQIKKATVAREPASQVPTLGRDVLLALAAGLSGIIVGGLLASR